jgi:hypothetical protein
MARPTQEDIARKVGADRTTVSKVLNNAPGTYVGDRLRTQIIEAAKRLGYGQERLRAVRRVRVEKRLMEIPAKVEIRLWDGSVHAKGTAVVVKLDSSAAELADLDINPPSIPLKPCYICLRLGQAGKSIDIKADFNRLYLVRFPRVSVKFLEMTGEAERAVGAFVRQHPSA